MEGEIVKKLGIIAGNGRFPIIVAQNAKKLNLEVVAVAHIGETLPELEQFVDSITWVKVGKLGKMIDSFRKEGVKDLLMAGGIKKTRLFTDVVPDIKSIMLLSKLAYKKDDMILRAIADMFEKEGFTIRESHLYLSSLLAPKGVICGKKPKQSEQDDINFGLEIARELGKMDIGQCVIVKNRVVVAVEAVEGTDEAIRRSGKLCGNGAVVVKVSKPQQDLRFDVPATGPETIKGMSFAGAKILAIEAEKTLMLDKNEMIQEAQQRKITIIGI